MADITVKVYRIDGDRELIAIIPLDSTNGLSEVEFIAVAMIVLKTTGRYADSEIEGFRYRFEHLQTSKPCND